MRFTYRRPERQRINVSLGLSEPKLRKRRTQHTLESWRESDEVYGDEGVEVCVAQLKDARQFCERMLNPLRRKGWRGAYPSFLERYAVAHVGCNG